jgi:hypothetical protein
METSNRRIGILRGVVDAAWDLAAKQAADKEQIRLKLVAGEEIAALDLMRTFLGCPKPIARVKVNDGRDHGSKQRRHAG